MTLKVDLQKSFADFSLDVAWENNNEILTLFGPSGSGKSLTLRIIAGLIQAQDKSKLYLGEENWMHLQAFQRNIGMVFQDLALFPHLNVEKNVELGILNKVDDDDERLLKVRAILEQFHILNKAHAPIAKISGGQKQRVAFARSLIGKPHALLLDEPFSNLDKPLKTEMYDVLKKIKNDFHIPIVLVTHDWQEVKQLSDKVCFYHRGRILQTGSVRELEDTPEDELISRYIG